MDINQKQGPHKRLDYRKLLLNLVELHQRAEHWQCSLWIWFLGLCNYKPTTRVLGLVAEVAPPERKSTPRRLPHHLTFPLENDGYLSAVEAELLRKTHITSLHQRPLPAKAPVSSPFGTASAAYALQSLSHRHSDPYLTPPIPIPRHVVVFWRLHLGLPSSVYWRSALPCTGLLSLYAPGMA